MPQGSGVGTHTLRHSYARHLLMNGIPINYLSADGLGHSVDSDDSHLPGACAGPDGQPGDGAVNRSDICSKDLLPELLIIDISNARHYHHCQ